MAAFHAIGVIAADIVRRETKKGVLARFRFASGAPGHGQLWIDVEAWGNTAGVLHTHGETGRGIAVTGRLTHNSWRDRTTGQQRSKLVVTAADFDFLNSDHNASAIDVPNHAQAIGRVDARPVEDETAERLLFTITSGHAGSKTGRLWLPVEAWGRTLGLARTLRKGDQIAVAGRLGYRTRPNADGEKLAQYELSAHSLDVVHEFGRSIEDRTREARQSRRAGPES